MKRERQEGEIELSMDMARSLMLLSKVGKDTNANDHEELKKSSTMGKVFSCKTCNKNFPSFQALGGHRASHKKPKLAGGDFLKLPSSPPRPKTHRCSICGLEFPIGQALGGHMRRHRAAAMDEAVSDDTSSVLRTQPLFANVPVLKRSNSSKRVLCLDLTLSLAPPGMDDNDLDLQLGKAISSTPALKCFT